MASFDLVVAGGTVFDATVPDAGVRADIGVRDGRIAALGDLSGAERARTLDATGLCVSAGWIDLHAHVFRPDGGPSLVPDRDAGVETGVTTIVDAGSFGALAYEDFVARTVRPCRTRVLGFLNISVDTTLSPRHGAWDRFDTRATLETLARDAGQTLVGVKVMASQTHCAGMGLEPVRLAVQAARLSGTRVMSHIGNSPPVLADVLDLLHHEDVVTHAWHGKPGGMLDRAGRPIAAALRAVDRGVRFDMGHGSASFAFEAGLASKAAGLPLHSISTDIHMPNHVQGPVYDLATTMSKALHIGFELVDVVVMVTAGPARSLALERQLGHVALGREADLTLFQVVEGPARLVDAEGVAVDARRRIVPRQVVRAGQVVACRDAFAEASGQGQAPGPQA